jgi:hypothetical protein
MLNMGQIRGSIFCLDLFKYEAQKLALIEECLLYISLNI